MPQLIEEFKKKQIKNYESKKSTSEKKERIMQEFREKFGFNVDQRSGKFKLFMAQRLAEEQQKSKEQKRLTKKQATQKMMEDMISQGSGSKF